MRHGVQASFEADWIDELRKEAEENHREIEERQELAQQAKIREKATDLIAFCFAASAVLMIGTWDGMDKLFCGTLIVLLFCVSLTCHFMALGFREEAEELGYGRDPWEH